jgi:hypothetical protein
MYVALGVEVNLGNWMAGSLGDLAEKGALGAAVALAERMDRVDLSVVVRQALHEQFTAQTVEDGPPVRGPLAASSGRGRCAQAGQTDRRPW